MKPEICISNLFVFVKLLMLEIHVYSFYQHNNRYKIKINKNWKLGWLGNVRNDDDENTPTSSFKYSILSKIFSALLLLFLSISIWHIRVYEYFWIERKNWSRRKKMIDILWTEMCFDFNIVHRAWIEDECFSVTLCSTGEGKRKKKNTVKLSNDWAKMCILTRSTP